MLNVKEGRFLPYPLLLLVVNYHLHYPLVSAVQLNYQDTALPFWEPLSFASLPTILETVAIFWQDTTLYGKVLTIAGTEASNGRSVQYANETNAVYQLDVGKNRNTLNKKQKSFLTTLPSEQLQSGGLCSIFQGISSPHAPIILRWCL